MAAERTAMGIAMPLPAYPLTAVCTVPNDPASPAEDLCTWIQIEHIAIVSPGTGLAGPPKSELQDRRA